MEENCKTLWEGAQRLCAPGSGRSAIVVEAAAQDGKLEGKGHIIGVPDHLIKAVVACMAETGKDNKLGAVLRAAAYEWFAIGAGEEEEA